MQEKLLNLMKELENGIEFTKEQAPIVIQQLLTYDLTVAYVMLALSLLVMTVCIVSIYNFHEIMGDGVALLGLVTFIGGIVLVVQISSIMKISIAPNLYVLDYIRALN